jgi:hypothetical protein
MRMPVIIGSKGTFWVSALAKVSFVGCAVQKALFRGDPEVRLGAISELIACFDNCLRFFEVVQSFPASFGNYWWYADAFRKGL